MVIRINELKLRPDHTKKELEQKIKKELGLSKNAGSPDYEIMRCSIDARKKPDLLYSYTIDVKTENPGAVIKRVKSKKVQLTEKKEYRFPVLRNRNYTADQQKGDNLRPVVVGSGPAGLFCALMLARSGQRPIVLERGEAVEERTKTVSEFWKTGRLNPQSNVQFGEGGAGTFSDGKLNTLIKDTDGIIRFVLKEFVQAGADPEILYHHKPHIGTDVLVQVVKHIRTEIEELGGEVWFGSQLTGLKLLQNHPGERKRDFGTGCGNNGRAVYELSVNDGARTLHADCVVLAIGHSARDTFSMLHEFGLAMQPKAFAMGLRVEHRQSMIDEAMYGKDCPYELGAAPYKVTHKCADGRGVYSFCMCPGGYVVNASSEEGMLAVNGMSYSDRGSSNANSAIVVTVTPEDYQADGPLSGIRFQRQIEHAAYQCGDGNIPVQRLEDFCLNRKTEQFGAILPQHKGGFVFSNLRTVLPDRLNQAIIEGMHAFGRRINGFDDPDVLLSGVESRTSSPVRIQRDEAGQSVGYQGIFPCGEGAGYAGGITSAAVDGIRTAEAVMTFLKK